MGMAHKHYLAYEELDDFIYTNMQSSPRHIFCGKEESSTKYYTTSK